MANWQLDNAHSELEFKVRHMMISTVKGQFKSFEINVDNAEEKLELAQVQVKIDVDSIDTKNEQRDQHLKSADFFDSNSNQFITFKSTSINKEDDENYKIVGDLTIKGITKSVAVDVEFGGIAKDPWGNDKVGYTVTGKINRSDFGLNWNAALETGGVMVSEEVKFSADLQFIKS
ncbi:YceI family protein [Sphingobacterium bovistauri]|uniref:Polyisoprenoid-binding protein n=1 Tax=Sphingobacterium bovistauri TaxID=2781959 RepID=A0ABS7ZB39_9SPHI|nr:YceI family protein [Sphingobacterium bovistauri]MCA5006812.1 polyisoprenoid-binding protein [Sphingobacterium bovistauri]